MSAQAVQIQTRATWPRAVCELLEQHHETLMAYFEHDEKFALAGWSVQSCNPNPYDQAYHRVIGEMDALLACESFIGWHATRLTQDEITWLSANGIVLSSEEFHRQRIRNRLAAGDFPQAVATALLAQHQYKEGARVGEFWLTFGELNEGHESALEALLRYWGGEAASLGHESNEYLRIGEPCLIEAYVPVAAFGNRRPGRDVIDAAMSLMRGERVRAFECTINAPLAATNILRVITREDHDFERLTQASTWPTSLL